MYFSVPIALRKHINMKCGGNLRLFFCDFSMMNFAIASNRRLFCKKNISLVYFGRRKIWYIDNYHSSYLSAEFLSKNSLGETPLCLLYIFLLATITG